MELSSNVYPGWIRGIRYWFATSTPNGIALRSVVKHTEWPVGKPAVARCVRDYSLFSRNLRIPEHQSPMPSHIVSPHRCRCGIYAVDGVDLLIKFPVTRRGLVWGYVNIWGTVITTFDQYGRREWRAQYAYPDAFVVSDIDDLISREPDKSIHTVPANDDIIFELGERYGVPVVRGFELTTGEVDAT